jgi:peptide/nickel transport system substrate-binding protein
MKGGIQLKKLVIGLVVAILCFVLLIPACTSKSSPATTVEKSPTTQSQVAATTSSATSPQKGGILKIIMEPGLTNMGYPNTNRSVLTDQICAAPCVENLVGLDQGGQGKPVPELATSWQYSADYSSITFTLRQGVKFHDGTDFDAQAAKYNLDIIKENSALNTLKDVKSIDVLDKYTIRLNLSSYDPTFISNLAATAAAGNMLSPTALKSMGEEAALHPIGTGPFKFVSYQTDVSLKYTRFENYWQPGTPYLDGIEFVFIKDATTALNTLKAGEAQALRGVDNKAASELMGGGKYNLNLVPQGLVGLAFDGAHADSPFSDIRVRQAVLYAIDTKAIVKTIGYGALIETNQVSAPGSYAYNPDVIGYPYNLQKAKDLLSQTKYPNGFDTQIHMENTALNRDLAVNLQGYLKEAKINLEIDMQDPAKYMQTRTNGWSNSMIMQMLPASPGFDIGLALTIFLSSKTTILGNSSIVNFPPDYQTKLEQASTERDPEKRQALFKQLSKTIIDQYCMTDPLYIEVGIAAYSTKVHDFYINKYAGCDFDPEGIWLSK